MNGAAPTTKEDHMEFKDISMESFRVYTFPGGDKIEIHAPQKIHVAESGSHRIVTAGGLHYLPAGFIHIGIALKPDSALEFSF